MNKKDDFSYGVWLFFFAFFLFVVLAYLIPYKTEVSHTVVVESNSYYASCVKGFCNMSGFTCLDENKSIFAYDNCECNEKGYICKG